MGSTTTVWTTTAMWVLPQTVGGASWKSPDMPMLRVRESSGTWRLALPGYLFWGGGGVGGGDGGLGGGEGGCGVAFCSPESE